MAVGSTVVITYDGTDITNRVLWSTARFEFQQNGVPGTFEITVKDVDHSNLFVTGKILELEIDGTLMVCGFGLVVVRAYPFGAMDTTNPDTTARYWRIQGADLNRLFDKRILHDPAHPTSQIDPRFTGADYDGDLIKLMCSDYLDLDLPTGLDLTTYVDNIMRGQDRGFSAGSSMAWHQQGDTFRQQVEEFTQFTGALYYFSADRALHHHAIEESVMRWGFSDKPNNGAITASPTTYQGSTIGPREIEATEDGSLLVNDAFIWGGSSWTQGVVFAEEDDATSITDHGLWQMAEVHIGEEGFGLQEGVDTRADLIVNGSPGAVGADQNRGLKYSQWSFKFAWFAHQVPTISGVRNHILPGYITQIELEVFGDGVDPLTQLLPCRSMTITFPSLDTDGNGYVRFDGQFGLQPSDPFTLWNFLIKKSKAPAPVVAIVDDSSDSTVYGAQGQFTPSPAFDGTTTVFTIPFGYIAGSSQFYLSVGGPSNGKLLFPGVDYTESDPINGEFTLIGALASSPPDSPDEALIQVRTLGA